MLLGKIAEVLYIREEYIFLVMGYFFIITAQRYGFIFEKVKCLQQIF